MDKLTIFALSVLGILGLALGPKVILGGIGLMLVKGALPAAAILAIGLRFLANFYPHP